MIRRFQIQGRRGDDERPRADDVAARRRRDGRTASGDDHPAGSPTVCFTLPIADWSRPVQIERIRAWCRSIR